MAKKLISMILSLVLCLGAASAALDTGGHWASENARRLYDLGVLTGDENGRANLGDHIKRSEFLALLVRALYRDERIEGTGQKSFLDVSHSNWYYDTASFAKQKGIIQGDENGNFYPDNPIRREEIVLMLVRALSLSGGEANGEAGFPDVAPDDPYFKEISAAVKSGIIRGFEDGSFSPRLSATRGDAVTMIARILELEPVPSPEPSPSPTPEPSVEPSPSPLPSHAPSPDPEGTDALINLTWHHFSGTGILTTGADKPGVNVISPTWFRIRSLGITEAAQPYEHRLESENNFYLQDIGNKDYVDYAHKRGMQVWALFKTNDFSANLNNKFLNDASAQRESLRVLGELIDKYDLDGINLDFENMLVSDKDAYTQYVREVSEVTRARGAVLSVDVTRYSQYGGTWSLCYDRKALGEIVDYVALMAYDQNGTSSKTAGSVGDIPWVEESILRTLEEVPAEKLILGIPFYARVWQSKGGVVTSTSAVTMDTAAKVISEAEAQVVYDEKTGQNYARWEKGGVVYEIWLEDAVSLKNRVALMRKYKLAGVASWSSAFANAQIWQELASLLAQ